MTSRLLLAILAAAWSAVGTVAGQTSQSTMPSERPAPRLRSPEVTADNVILRLHAPKAESVSVWTEWDCRDWPLQRGDDGIWLASLPWPEPNIYAYKFLVDGVSTVDPLNPQVRRSRPPASLVEVGGADSPFADRDVPHGQVDIVHYASTALGLQRRMHVYTPPGYDRDSERLYPVLYLLHGSGNDDEYWHRLGRAGMILDNLLAEGRTPPMLIVMPNGHVRRSGEAAQRGAMQDRRAWGFGGYGTFGVPGAFADDLFIDVLPYVETHYRARRDAAGRAVAGTSMGGNQAVALGLKYPDRFQYVLSFSGAHSDGPAGSVGDLVPDAAALNSQLRLLWIGMGTSDSLHPGTARFVAALRQAGVTHVWHETPGHHTWPQWRVHLHQTLPLLFSDDHAHGR